TRLLSSRRDQLQPPCDTSRLVREARWRRAERKISASPTPRSPRRRHLQHRSGNLYLWNKLWLVESTARCGKHPADLSARWLEVRRGNHARFAETQESTRRTRVHVFGRVRQPAHRVGCSANVDLRRVAVLTHK